MKKITALFLLIMLLLISTACSTGSEVVPAEEASMESSSEVSGEAENANVQETGTSGEITASIALAGDRISVDGSGVTISGSTATITKAGTFVISGDLDDGQIIVESAGEGAVELVLDGASITNVSSSPIYISGADEVSITLAEGSRNFVTDGASYVFTDLETDEPDAAIFSTSDLTIQGSGALTVNANYKNGIASKDDLNIKGGTIIISAVNDGIKGKDSVEIEDGTLTITAGSDGIQSSNDTDAEKGFVSIEGGDVNITAGLDGIQAATNLTIIAGAISITSGGGSANSSTQTGEGQPGRSMDMPDAANDSSVTESMKGLKAGAVIAISGGEITIDSADDALNSNDNITISGGQILIASGDDGMHANTTLQIDEGEISITQSYEGIESASITINGGTIRIVASDDGINVAGGNDGSAANGRPGQNEFSLTGDYNLTINGGSLVVDAGGDGLDANGSIAMSGGQVIVNGPTNDGNGPIDYLGTFNITGGVIVAVGSSGMAQTASDTSTQYSLLYNFDDAQTAGTLIHIETAEGEELLTFAPGKDFQSILYSSPDLQNGMAYNLYTGGSSNEITVDGLYTNGLYTAGNQTVSFTVSSIVTKLGAAGSPMGGGKGGRGGGPGGGGAQPPG